MRFPVTVALLAASVVACGAGESPTGEVTADCEETPRIPVLFVHGSGLTSDSWGSAVAEFQRAGYPDTALLAVDLVPNDGDNIAAAEQQISDAVSHLLTLSREQARECPSGPVDKVDIVAHSMGALSSRWYASRVAPERVRFLVTVAGANHGTDAICGYRGRGNEQMCPAFTERTGRKEVQVPLNGRNNQPVDETPFGIGSDGPDRPAIAPDDDRRIVYLTVRLEPDEWIIPPQSAELCAANEAVCGV